jgi:hypothetical protein
MTQISIKKLDSLSHNDTAATKTINDNFQAVQKALEDSLSRKETAPNYMDTDLDMNSKRIINTAEPVSDFDVINKKYFDERVGDAKAFADAASKSAAKAESYAKAAAVANTNAQTAVDRLQNNLLDNYYTKTEVDTKDVVYYNMVKADIDSVKLEFNYKIGNIDKALDEINGEIV